MNATVRPSGDKRACPSFFAPSVSWRGVAAVGVERHEPDRVAVAVVLRGGGLERDQGVAAVGRERAGRSRSGAGTGRRGRALASRDPPSVGGSGCAARCRRGDEAESSGYHRATMRDQLSLRLEPDVPVLPNLPATLRPMLPRPIAEPFDSDAHLFEPSWGGLRALAFIGPAEIAGSGDVTFVDGDGRELPALPELAGLAVRVDARSAVLDGELVVVGANGLADADELARRLGGAPRPAGGLPRVRPAAHRRAVDDLGAARPPTGDAPEGAPAGRRGRGRARDRRRGPGAPRGGRGPGDRGRDGPPAVVAPTCPGSRAGSGGSSRRSPRAP